MTEILGWLFLATGMLTLVIDMGRAVSRSDGARLRGKRLKAWLKYQSWTSVSQIGAGLALIGGSMHLEPVRICGEILVVCSLALSLPRALRRLSRAWR
jgi:hypothetical protein